jgi:hypothetical protein
MLGLICVARNASNRKNRMEADFGRPFENH